MYDHLEEAIDDLRSRFGGLPVPAEAEEIWDDLWHQEAHHSTALEGNTLILNEVRKLLDEGRTVGDKELKEYMEVLGYANAAKWVYGQALEPGDWTAGDLLSLQEVRTVHYEAMTPVWNVAPHPHATPAETPGNWRQHDIAPFPDGMTPPPFPDVDHRMADWVADVNKLRDDSDVAFPERLAKTHNEFEKIHPYLDGNGRSGRLLLNLLLVRLGYPPAIVFKNERTKYLNAMRKADKGEYGPLGEVIARAVANNLYKFVVPAVAGPARLVPLASLVDAKAGLTATALRAAAERGRLRAQKSDNGKWQSSKSWVADYQKNKHKRPAKARKPD
ncbi:Fic family protein [Aeromicrobium sp. A1-2]|nr:Fic family protein [Aeromicrobium sp. A1-2]